MSDLSNERLEEIEARCRAATPGPWGWEVLALNLKPWVRGWLMTSPRSRPQIGIIKQRVDILAADADFIAHARADIPALLEEIERLRESLRT